MKITTKVTSRNRVTIPAALARELDIVAGMKVKWEINEDRDLIVIPLPSGGEPSDDSHADSPDQQIRANEDSD